MIETQQNGLADLPNDAFRGAHVLIYSHDTFGLGHLRRCREIANALVEAYRGISVLIISGAAVAGAFDYRVRVDFVKIPSVIKLRNGEYTSMSEHISLEDTLHMRKSIIKHTAEIFQPDIFITDKEPVGLRGEVEETLAMLKARGTHLVLGLRDVMDAPHLLELEWEDRDSMAKIERYYDTIWVYGPKGFNDPLAGLEVPPQVSARLRYTGFLERTARDRDPEQSEIGEDDYILVTTGGGGDGAELTDQVLSAYEWDRTLKMRAVVVLGPYLPAKDRDDFMARAADLPLVTMIDFDNRMEDLVAGATAVVGMGGYNTFCEILSFDKPSLIVPRTEPRQEQLIRAERAAQLGLVTMLLPSEAEDRERLAQVLHTLPDAPPPSASGSDTLRLDGLTRIVQDVGQWLSARSGPELAAAQG